MMLKLGLLFVAIVVILSLLAPLIAPYDPTKAAGPPLSPPSMRHFFGTDNLGRDVFSRVLYGGQVIIGISILATLLSASVGFTLGMFSGYIGGRVDRALNVVMDSMYAFPSLILAIAIASVLGPSPLNAAVAIGVVYIPTYFRMGRNETMVVKSSPFIEAAVSLGVPRWRIVFRHILPNLIPSLVVVATINIADAALTESALAFFGYTVTPPTPDWGLDLSSARSYIINGSWWLLAPGFFIVITALGFSMMGEGLGERLGKKEI
ncbi:ABC transporter permease [Pyrobaculum aerophilum]|uniref:ABC transporter permease n=1 Tax=Pyrobaculum aerophilum TaxID=13773 RepID=UPI0023F46B59|nr:MULTISPECIES: ABC transporter permease [Pyrobaculum]MCX8135787.1 ABC transporter permease [Pyrobaculum aerophilum]